MMFTGRCWRTYLDVEDALEVVERCGFHYLDGGLLASALARPARTYSRAGGHG